MASTRQLFAAVLAVAALIGSWLVAAPASAATGTISGTVKVRAVGGQPVGHAGAQVVFDRATTAGEDPSFENSVASVTTGAGGAFASPALADGRYRVRVYPGSFAGPGTLGHEYFDDRWSPYDVTLVTVAGGATTLGKDVVLQPTGWVTGTVRDEAGQPIAGATVTLSQTPGRGGGYGIVTDAQGRYDTRTGDYTDNTIPGSYRVEAGSYGSDIDSPVYTSSSADVAIAANAGVQRDFVLKRLPQVVFTLQDTNGSPLANAPLNIQEYRSDLGGWGPIQSGPHETDEEGRYRFVGYPGRSVKVYFGTPAGYTGSGVGEYWDGPTGDGAYALRDAAVVDFPQGVAMNRSYTVRLGAAPAISAGSPTITGTPKVGQTLTLVPGTWGPGAVDLDVQWLDGGFVIPGQTERELTLTPDLEGSYITARVTGAKAGADAVDRAAPYLGPVTAGAPPVSFTRPTISGTPRVGSTLTAVPGAWGPSGVALAYQWYAAGQAVGQATAQTFVPTAAEQGKAITVRVTGSLTGYSTVARTSAATAAVAAAPAVSASTPTISGTAQVGSTLTAVPGAWGPDGVALAYQWFAGGQPVAGATASTLALTAAQQGQPVTVRVTGTLAGHTPAERTSAATAAVAAAPEAPAVSAGTPTVAGTARTGQRLTARPGSWGPTGVTLGYQWLADGTPIAGAAGASYVVTNAVAGRRISVRVTGTLAGAAAVVRDSAPTAASVGLLTAPRPRITGTARQGRKLTVKLGTWSPGPVRLTYTWLRNGTRIAGATRASYTLRKADVGKRISVRVTGARASYATVVKVSARTGKVKRQA
ncbi:carboxypeptidase regulatory-like domain-containing protein [Nocardioides sp. SYSU D00038]|uniref:carboxypeptidase regulatory-like domain-containing protein n=1 Tax=Nocardioides sp. SYSU D00038 TaxID=2812554 RepID=UPI0019687DAB|nr:carboxypeptidase regulatory-like domain-containing protein [Nocardioides sp. SYSU D00038]